MLTLSVYLRLLNMDGMGISLFIVHYEYVGTTELRCLDGVEREHQDDIFGSVIGCSARTPVEELKQEWLKTGWSEDTLAHPLVYARGKSNTEKSGLTWTAHQVSMYIHLTIGWLLILLKDLGISDRRRCEAIRTVSIPVGGAGRALMDGGCRDLYFVAPDKEISARLFYDYGERELLLVGYL